MSDRRRSASLLWFPLALAALTLAGLVVALIGGPVWAFAAWIALAAPLLAAGARIVTRRRRA